MVYANLKVKPLFMSASVSKRTSRAVLTQKHASVFVNALEMTESKIRSFLFIAYEIMFAGSTHFRKAAGIIDGLANITNNRAYVRLQAVDIMLR